MSRRFLPSILGPRALTKIGSTQLFRAEFIFPTTPLAENLQKTLQGLEADSIVTVTRSASTSAIESVTLSQTERQSGRENFDFYCFLIWPFIESSWLSAVSLLMLTPPTPAPPKAAPRPAVYSVTTPAGTVTKNEQAQETQALPLTTVINHAQLLGKTLYAQGDLSYLEAVNKETLRNSYNQFSAYPNPIISILPSSKDGKIPARVVLNKEWMPLRSKEGGLEAEGVLWDFCERISHGRREGKNRRDGGTVVRRVLGHVELVGTELWNSATDDGKSKKKGGKGKKKVPGQDIQAQARARGNVLSKL